MKTSRRRMKRMARNVVAVHYWPECQICIGCKHAVFLPDEGFEPKGCNLTYGCTVDSKIHSNATKCTKRKEATLKEWHDKFK